MNSPLQLVVEFVACMAVLPAMLGAAWALPRIISALMVRLQWAGLGAGKRVRTLGANARTLRPQQCAAQQRQQQLFRGCFTASRHAQTDSGSSFCSCARGAPAADGALERVCCSPAHAELPSAC